MLRRGKKLQMIPPMTLPGQRANRYGTNIGGYGILVIPSYEKATLPDGKRGFFFNLCGVRRPPSDRIPSAVRSDSVRRPIRFRPPSDRIPFAVRSDSERRPSHFLLLYALITCAPAPRCRAAPCRSSASCLRSERARGAPPSPLRCRHRG